MLFRLTNTTQKPSIGFLYADRDSSGTPKDMAMIEVINTLYVAHLREQEDDDFTDAVMSAAAGGAVVSY